MAQGPVTFQELVSRASDEHWIQDVRAYLDSDGDINHTDERQGCSLLHYAAEHQQPKLIRYLAEKGAILNIQDRGGWTPLHLAVDADLDGAIQNGAAPQRTTASALIKAGAGPTIRNKQCQTPRDIAGLYGERASALYDSIS